MAPTLTPEAETSLRAATEGRKLDHAHPREDVPAQGLPEWEQRLWSLGQHSHGVPLPPDATSREVMYEDTAF